MKNADYYRKNLNLEPVKCNGFLKTHFSNSAHFDFAYYLIEKGVVCPWHRMMSLETCHYIDGDPVVLLQMKDGVPFGTVLGPQIDRGHSLHAFIIPGTWCCFYLEETSAWGVISHFNFPSYVEETCDYLNPEQFISIFPEYPDLAMRFGLKGFYNKNSLI